MIRRASLMVVHLPHRAQLPDRGGALALRAAYVTAG